MKLKQTSDLLFELAKPFKTDEIEWRAQRVAKDKMGNDVAMMLAYVTVNTVRERLDEVMGANWQCKHEVFGSKTICHLGLKLDGEWIWRSDGAGDTAYEADKGAISDSLNNKSSVFTFDCFSIFPLLFFLYSRQTSNHLC